MGIPQRPSSCKEHYQSRRAETAERTAPPQALVGDSQLSYIGRSLQERSVKIVARYIANVTSNNISLYRI